jgi:HSP20 family protein
MLTRWNSNQELQSMRQMMDRFFEDFASNFSQDIARPFASPAIDVVDGEDAVEIHADLPGVPEENVNVEFKNGSLFITAHVNHEQNEEKANYTRRERYSGTYQRSLSIPDSLDVSKAEANFENGVLRLRLPRKPESQPVRIPVGNTKTIEAGKDGK